MRKHVEMHARCLHHEDSGELCGVLKDHSVASTAKALQCNIGDIELFRRTRYKYKAYAQ